MEYYSNDTDGVETLYMTDAEIADLFLSLRLGGMA